jgi:hypothetical protein
VPPRSGDRFSTLVEAEEHVLAATGTPQRNAFEAAVELLHRELGATTLSLVHDI